MIKSNFKIYILYITILFTGALFGNQLVIAQEKLPDDIIQLSLSAEKSVLIDSTNCDLVGDYGTPAYLWPIPARYRDHPFTSYAQNFAPPLGKTIAYVNLTLYSSFPDYTATSGHGVDLIIYTGETKPETEIIRVNIPESELRYYSDTTVIDLSEFQLNFYDKDFYVGITLPSLSDDTIALITDDADVDGLPTFGFNPLTNRWESIEDWSGGEYHFMIDVVYCNDPKTIRVPEDYTTISEAVEFALKLDTILINDGIYTGAENIIKIDQRSLIIKSVNGPEKTILDGTGTNGTAFDFTVPYNHQIRYYAEVDGFTFKNFTGKKGGAIGGSYNHTLSVKNSVFFNNFAFERGGAINCGGVDLVIENCTFSNNETSYPNGVIFITGGNPSIQKIIVAHSKNSSGIYTLPFEGKDPIFDIRYSNIYNNQYGDWTEPVFSQAHIKGNISEDPLFCDTLLGDLHLSYNSFCSEDHPLNSRHVLIGALDANCIGHYVDNDDDRIVDVNDNCIATQNPLQTDIDFDGIGDSCDSCTDSDNDGFGNIGIVNNICPDDNCPDSYNPDQADFDLDGIGDSCDTCTDTDNDGFGNPNFTLNKCPVDNCPDTYNPDQSDFDNDGIGDDCDECTDSDNDGYGNSGFENNNCPEDNCNKIYNPDQRDLNNDGIGDACCCDGIRGNINSDSAQNIDISDLIIMIELMFNFNYSHPNLCSVEIDIDADNNFNIADLVYMVDYMFQGGVPPVTCP